MSFPTNVNHEITVPVGQTGYVKTIIQYAASDDRDDIVRAINEANSLSEEYVSVHAQPPLQG